MDNITGTVSIESLQAKANEMAQKGAESVIEQFYTGYNSPYKKALEEQMKSKVTDSSFDLPDIIVSINEKIQAEIDIVANTAVAKTFIPLAAEMLTRAEKKIKFSEVLKEFINLSDFEYNDDLGFDDFEIEFAEPRHSFQDISISFDGNAWELPIRLPYKSEPDELPCFYTLPKRIYNSSYRELNQRMTLTMEGGAKLEMPFTSGVLQCSFTRFIARLIMSDSHIVFDQKEFTEDLFPLRDGCHC